MISVVDAFCGGGGFRLAWQQAADNLGMKIHFSWSIDNDEYATSIYRANFGHGVVTGRFEDEWPNFEGEADVLLAGFPCQPFTKLLTNMRSKKGEPHGFEESRGLAFFDLMAFADARRPKVIVFENVENIVHHDGGTTIRVMRDMLSENYNLSIQAFNSAGWVPQSRVRIFFLAIRKDLVRKPSKFNHSYPKLTPRFGDVMHEVVDHGRVPRTNWSRWHPKELEWYRLKESTWDQFKNSTTFPPTLVNADTRATSTLVASYASDPRNILVETDHPLPRTLTPREAARLQGFPDSYFINLSDSRAFRIFGNAVTVPIAQIVAEYMLREVWYL